MRLLDGTIIHRSASFKKLILKEKASSLLIERMWTVLIPPHESIRGFPANISYEALTEWIQKKLKLYAKYSVQGNKEKKMLAFAQLETIKETLARFNIDLDINYSLFLATLHDLENNKIIEIDI